MFLVCKCKRFDHWPGRFQLALFERGFCLASIVRRSAELKLDVWKDNFQSVCKYEFQLLSDERPYRCHLPDCGRAFIQLSNLQQHLKNHDAKVLKARNKLQCAFSMWNLSEIFFGIRQPSAITVKLNPLVNKKSPRSFVSMLNSVDWKYDQFSGTCFTLYSLHKLSIFIFCVERSIIRGTCVTKKEPLGWFRIFWSLTSIF